MSTSRLKGLVALVAAGVEHGSAAIEKVQLETAGRTFRILEAIPPLAVPTRVVRAVHDVSVKTTHGSIRLVTAIVKGGADLAIDAASSPSKGTEEIPASVVPPSARHPRAAETAPDDESATR